MDLSETQLKQPSPTTASLVWLKMMTTSDAIYFITRNPYQGHPHRFQKVSAIQSFYPNTPQLQLSLAVHFPSIPSQSISPLHLIFPSLILTCHKCTHNLVYFLFPERSLQNTLSCPPLYLTSLI